MAFAGLFDESVCTAFVINSAVEWSCKIFVKLVVPIKSFCHLANYWCCEFATCDLATCLNSSVNIDLSILNITVNIDLTRVDNRSAVGRISKFQDIWGAWLLHLTCMPATVRKVKRPYHLLRAIAFTFSIFFARMSIEAMRCHPFGRSIASWDNTAWGSYWLWTYRDDNVWWRDLLTHSLMVYWEVWTRFSMFWGMNDGLTSVSGCRWTFQDSAAAECSSTTLHLWGTVFVWLIAR